SIRTDADGMMVTLTGDWIAREATGAGSGAAQEILEGMKGRRIAFDATGLGHWDSALLVFLVAVRHEARARKIVLDLTGLPPAALRLLTLAAEVLPGAGTPRGRPKIMERV